MNSNIAHMLELISQIYRGIILHAHTEVGRLLPPSWLRGRWQAYGATCALLPAGVATPGCEQRECGVWAGWGWVGIIIIPLSAGSSDRQLLPHLLPCWMDAYVIERHSPPLPLPHALFSSCFALNEITNVQLLGPPHLWLELPGLVD